MGTDKLELNRMPKRLPSWLGIVAIGLAAILIAAFIIFFEF